MRTSFLKILINILRTTASNFAKLAFHNLAILLQSRASLRKITSNIKAQTVANFSGLSSKYLTHHISLLILLAFLFCFCNTYELETDTDTEPCLWNLSPIDSCRMMDDLEYLSSDEMRGRLTGSDENETALDYVISLFSNLGLENLSNTDNFRQDFDFLEWEQTERATLEIGDEALKESTDFTVLHYSGSVDTASEIVFAGYGLTIPPFDPEDYPHCSIPSDGYDDYEGIGDLNGKIALVMRHGPNEDYNIYENCPVNNACVDNTSPCLYYFGYKAANASAHGANAMLIIQDYRHEAKIPSYRFTLQEDYFKEDFAAFMVDRDKIEFLVSEIPKRAMTIDTLLKPSGFLTGVTAKIIVSTEIKTYKTANAVAMLKGDGSFNETIILGANIDSKGSIYVPNTETDTDSDSDIEIDTDTDSENFQYYNGADDNASGVAVLMELARALSKMDGQLKRDIVFTVWNAKTKGRKGSDFFKKNLPIPAENILAVINIEKVGMGNASGITFHTEQPSDISIFEELMTNYGRQLDFDYLVTTSPHTFYSDSTIFTEDLIPSYLVTTTGSHSGTGELKDTFSESSVTNLRAAASLIWAAVGPLCLGRENLLDK